MRLHAPMGEPDDRGAEPADERVVVGCHEDRRAARLKLVQPVEALLLEAEIADGQHLVDQQSLRSDAARDREGEAEPHAVAVRAQGMVEELLELREGDDLGEHPLHLALAEAGEDARRDRVLASREERVEGVAEGQDRGDVVWPGEPARGRLAEAGDEAQQGRLARAVRSDHADGRALVDLEAHVAQGPERLAAAPGWVAQELLDRGPSGAPRVALRDALDGDRRPPPHICSGTESRNRAKTSRPTARTAAVAIVTRASGPRSGTVPWMSSSRCASRMYCIGFRS